MTYKNQYGVIENNQLVVLTLADGTTEKVEPLYLSEAETSFAQFPVAVIDKYGTRIPWDSDTIWAVDEQKRRPFLRQVDKFIFDTEYGEVEIPIGLIVNSSHQ